MRGIEKAGLNFSDGVLGGEVGAVGLDVGEGSGGKVLRLGEGGENLVVLPQLEANVAEDVGFVPLELTTGHKLGSS